MDGGKETGGRKVVTLFLKVGHIWKSRCGVNSSVLGFCTLFHTPGPGSCESTETVVKRTTSGPNAWHSAYQLSVFGQITKPHCSPNWPGGYKVYEVLRPVIAYLIAVVMMEKEEAVTPFPPTLCCEVG